MSYLNTTVPGTSLGPSRSGLSGVGDIVGIIPWWAWIGIAYFGYKKFGSGTRSALGGHVKRYHARRAAAKRPKSTAYTTSWADMYRAQDRRRSNPRRRRKTRHR